MAGTTANGRTGSASGFCSTSPFFVELAVQLRSEGILQDSSSIQIRRPHVGGSMCFARRQIGLRWFVLLALLMVCAETASATTVIIPADDDLMIGARAIVRGRVISVTCAFDDQQR